MSEAHKDILPVLMHALISDDNSEEVKERILYSIDSYTENLDEDEIEFYVNDLITALVATLSKSSILSNKEQALKALGSVVGAAGKKSISR